MLPLDEITEKATREQFSNRIEPVRAEVNEVLQSLIEELDNVRRIQTTYDNVAEKLLSTESNMTATTQETPEKILSKSAEIGEVLPVLRQELETMAQSLTKPMKFVEIPQQVQPSHLENKLNEVATSNANMVKKAVTDQKVALLAPQIEALTASLQSTVNEVKNAPPASLDQQESTLRMLEAEKQKITTLLESIPEDAKEAETIKEKSTWELGRLADLIKRLGETVGEKVAALSSFFAAKAEVESQLAEIGRQLEEQQKGEDASAEPNISALAEQQQKVEKLREKLRVEIAADSLDQERSAEFDQLMSSLELMLVKIANAREAAERQIALKKVADLQKSKVNRANNELVSLIEQAFRLLNDAAAIPQSYEDLALKIAEVLNAAEQLAQEDPSAETLQSNIAEAHSAKQRLDDRWATWLKFVEERKSANTFLDAARKPLDIVEKKALRNMDEAQQDLADLIDGQGALVQLNETLEKLQTFAEQLDPLETSYADVRFLDVDYEQSEKQYEPIMSDLRSEIDQENQLLESTKHLEAELIHMRNTVSQLENLDELTNQSDSIIPEMTSALDNLKQQNALASKERRMVNPTSGLAKNAELLDELKAYLTQRIATLTEKQQQLEIEEIRSELHQIQQNPSDSQIENIESKFNQLKFSNVSTEELKQELANIKHERAEKQRLEKELGDKLRMITQELGQILLIHPLLASQVSEKTKKRKKKDTAKVATTADRSSQIAELRKSAELIETKLLPSLNQLQADIANAGLTTIATQKEVEHAAKLLDNIKSELAAKEQEKTNVEGVLHAAQELEELTSGQPHAEMPNMEATNEDLARKQIDALQADIQKINEALERLDKEPTSASMTKDEEDTLRKSKEHARAHLKQLVENCSDLQRHIDLLGELHKRNDTLAEKVLADGQALSTLQQKYQTGSVPQSLIAAEDDLRRAESIRFELDEANERLLSLQKWVGTALPQSKEASDLTKSIEETLNNCRSELDNLTQPLQEGVDLGKKIQSEKNSVSQKLSEMVSKAKDIHSISDPSQRSAELSALQQQIDPLHTQLQQLEQQLAHTEPAYVLPIEGSELDILGKSMEELKSLLSSEAEDAAKKLANAQTAAGLREISNRLRENIERAERIDIDSNAKREDLLSAMHLLEESKAELEEMQRIAESLDPTDEQANEVRNKAANEQAELGEQLLILRQSLDDRTDTLKKFDEELAKAEEDLDKLARMLAEPKESTSVEYIENILKKSDELFPSAILTLKNLAEAAKPIVEPRRKVDALLQRQADFIANAKAAEKQAEENEKRIAYTQKLAALEEELKAIEHALQTSIQLKTAETLRGFNNDSVRPLFDKFEALEEAPNEELKEQRQKLKAASIKLKNNADEKEKQVVQQENLIRDIDAQISQHEAALAAILSRYENAQPASKVEEDIHELEKIKDSALMLPLDEITEKATREQFSNRIEPVRAEVNEVLQSLIEELDNVRRIQTTYDNVAEKLLSTESNMTATTQETPEKILSKSAEIGEVLPVLRQELETMAQSLTKPMKFVEIPQQVQPSHLENKLNEVATSNANMVKKAVTDQKVALLAPQIEALTASLQSTVNEVKNAPPASLDQQESTLRMLEAEKQKITTLLESIPEDAKEAETIKEKSTWELGRLADLIKRLGETVGEKVAALSSFFAAKAEVESQLAEIGRQLEEQQKGEDASAEPNISALAEQQQKVEKLREKLRVEIAADSLDQERSAEFDQLMSSLELMLVKIANAREAAERQIALKKVADLQKSKVNRANNELVSLIEQAFRLLNDAAAIPQSYEDLALKIAEVLNAAEQLAQEDPSAETLQSNIAEAHSAKQRLDDRWATWLKFVEERKSANTFLDAARKPLDIVEKKALRNMDEAQQDLADLIDGQGALVQLNETLEKLQTFAEQLDPLETSYADVRFLDVDYEQSEKQYEPIMSDLRSEIDQENQLLESTKHLEAELIHMRNNVSQLENLDELTNQSDSIIPEMTSTLDNLKQQNALASKERRMVNPTSGLNKNAELLDELKAYLTQRIATLTEKQQQLEIEEIRSELHQIQQNPSDSQIENIESKFNQLKFSNVSTEELKQELANIKHERAEKQRLEKELGDKLRMITQELGQILLIHPLLASQVSEKTKKRKKKDTAKVATTADRSSQIAELRKSAELIETKLLPSLNQLQADIANAGLTTIATQKEVEHAAKLLDNIKSELAAKEQEKTNVEGVLHAAQELEELTSGQPHAEMPNMEATNEDLARKQIDALQADIQKINEALERLDKEPTSASMTKDEEDTLRKSKEHARAHLKQLVENCSDLQRHIDLLGELHKRNDTLAEKVLADGQALSTLQQKYQTGSVPQSLIAAEDDLRRAESIRFELDEANERLLSLQKWVGTALPQSKEASDLTKSIEETLNNCRSELDNLTQPLQEGVDLGKKIQSEKNSVSQKLSEMVSKAKDIHSISDPSQRSAELSALQQQIDPLHTQLQQLEQQLAHTEPAYVLPIEGSELDILGKSMEELKSLLSSEAEDAAKKLANAQTAAGLREISNRLRENIERAERIDIDSNAKREDLLSAMHLLEESKAELEEMQRIAESLDPTDEQANEVRNKAANEQAELGEQLLILRQSLDDRTDTLKKFDEELAKAEEDLDKLARMLAEPKESTSVEYIENILKKSDELFPSAILTLKNLAEAAKPIVEPRRKVDALLQRQADFIANAKAAEKQAEENEKRIAYTQKLAALEEELKAIEHALQTSIQLKTAETLRGFNNDSVRPLFDKFEALEEAPNEELKEQRQKLKAASIKLKNNADEKEKQVVQQENLIRDIDAQISQHEAALAAILSRYENAQPASKVEEDIHELEKIKDSALMLPLDEITEKATREQFSNRIEPVRAEVNEVLQSLIEELDNVRRIQTTYDNVAEKLLSTESNMTATTQETPEKILSKSAEIGEVLPVLRQELETMAQSLTKPMKFVEIPQQVQPSHLENKLNEVATSNANMVKKAVTDQKVALLAPQIEALTASLQSTVNEVKNAPPASLDQQESTLRMLEAEKQKITTLLESIPEDAKEAETIKEKSTWELGRLADLIKRLGETVGEKVAALSSFFAAKAEVESQLAEIGRQLEEQQKGEDASAEPNISALAEQQQKVEKLREKLRVEIAADSLDQERSAEFDQLMSSLELMLVKIANAREAAERQIALKKVADLQKSKVNRANNELVSLIEQAFRLLNDAAAIPQSYEDLALKIAEVLNAAEQLAQEDPSAETLQSNIAEAHSAKQRLDDRWATWLKFVEERKSANTFLDAARKPLDIVEKKALRNMDEAQQDLADLIDGQGALVQLNETLEKLQTFAEQLDPLETSYADVRFLDVDYEQSEKQYEPIMSDLRSEIDQENQLLESTKHLEAELIHMRNTVSQLENLDELTNQSDSIIPEMTSALDNLKQQNALASKERRMVNPTSGLAKNAELLDELKAYLTQRIATLTEKQQQLEIEEIRSELHQIQQNPSDSQIENIESKFNQLKFSNVSTEELKQELANIKHERAEKQRLEKELGDKLRMITQELGQILLIHPLLASQVSEKTKKRKKKDTAKVATTADRSSQIAELRKSAELIETKLLPSLNQLQADIANAGLTTIATQKEVEHAAKLLDNIKSELAAKEQEKTNVEGVLHAAQELEELTSGQPHAEMPNMEATNEDLARKQIDALQADIQKINEALERLDKEPTSASMTKDEEDTLRKSKEHARAHLKQLVENCSDLQRHIDLLGELHKRNDTLAEKVLADGQALSTLQQKYQTGSVPQSLIAAEDDLRRAESIRFELDEANERLLSLQKWVGTALPQSKEASDLTKSIEETLNNCRSELDNLTQPLQEGVDLGKKIQSEKNSVSQKLSEMVSKAKDIHSISDPSQRSAELSALQQQIDPLHTQLQQLEQQLAHTEPAYVLPIEGSELDILGKSMEELKSLLSSEAEDAAKKLANAQTAAGLREISNRLRENIERAERIDIDSNAKREDLLSAMHLLEESKAELEEMQRIAESLDPTDEQANEVRNKAANEQAELGEQLLILRQSLDDRTDTLKKFDEELAKAEEDLDKLARMLAEPKESTSVEYIENILKKSDELFPSAILTLKNLAEAAKPIVEPRRKVDALLQRQADFIANAKAAEKQAEENEKRIAYTQKLAALEEELKAIEHALQTSIQLKTAETLRGFNNDSVRPLFDKFEALEEAPNEELKEQRQKLKAASIKLKNNADEKEKQVVQQENLIRDIDAQISQHEAALAAILSRYENAQPASKVEEDIHELEKIKDSALMLPLDEITEKATREQFSNRIEPVRAEVNEVLQSLIEELDNVRRIQTTYDNVAEKLLSTESNMTATTQETPEKILSKSAEIGEVLPVLRQELETMAQSLTKPMKFVEIPQQVQPSHLENKLNEVATSNANMVKKAVTDQKVALLAPQIEALTASLQSTVNEVKNAPPASLDQQESTLRMLEAEKQKITTLLESIPEDAKEAETIKEKSTWELGRLADLIKRLGETVGEKVAALSSFFAAKAEVESQLAEIGRQLEEQQKGEDASAEPNISALAEQQQKVEKLREKLRVEIAADSLDQERSAEFDQLMSSLELMLVKIANAREAAERQIALKKVADLQKSKVNRANNELVSLIEQAFRLLNDAAAIPQSYEDLALKIAEVLNAAEQLAQEDPSAETLQSNIAEAHSAKQRLDDRWATWLKFVEERKSANTFLDAARKPLDIVEKKALRNMDEAQQDLADLIDGQGALVQLNETLEKLQTFAEQLDPLETSYADVRFLDVDYEQSEKQYEPIMSDLRSEIDQENQLLESTKHLEAELIHMRNTVSQLENLDELTNQSDSIIPEMTSALDNLKQQNALASKERRMVNPTSGLAKNAELLDELKAYLTQRIATLTEKQQQLEIEEIRSELHQIQQNPSDSQIENIESKFNQLKFSNVSTEELKQELANIKHERAEKQRLEKELGDKLRMITQELGQILLIHPLLASQVSEKTKKRKKKDTAKVATTADRSSQIAELRKSAELIETKLLPSLNQLQADIANAGLTTIATQKEVEHAAKLLDNIKSELAAKEQEKTNVEGVLHAAQELEELTSGQPHAEMPNMEATNEDLARKQIDALQADIQKINEALERLDKEPTSASMTKDEEDTLRKSKEHARAHLKQLVENCSDLQRHIDLLGELHKRNDTLAEKVLADGQALSTLQQKYQTGSVPQSLIAAEDDLRRAESIRYELDEANERLLSLQKWVGTALPQSKEASDLTKSIEETLNNCRSELDNLTQPLQEGVDLGKKIQSEKNSVSQKLSEMVSKAKDIHSISDPSQRSAELSALQQQIDPLHTQLQQLEQQLAHTEPAYVLPIEGSELDILGKSMEELKSLLSSEAEDAAKKLANAQTAAGLREISNRLRENIERAERIDIDSNAKREDLLSAMHLLEESKAELEEMQRIAESLDPTDEQANEVRNKAANEQAELGEQLLILRQSLDDRTDTLKKFDEELAKAEEDLDKLARMLAEPKESTSVEYIENILKKSDELFPSAILTLKNLAEAAKPIVEPRRKVDALLQRQADFIANAKAAEKQAEENEKRIAYTQKLAALEEELKAIEHALQTSIQLKTAETLRGFNNDSVRPLFDKFEALEEAPNEELKEQRQKLKAASIKLKNNADEKEKQVVQQENLIRDIDAQISQHEAALAAILSRYENAQPASKVEEDIHELEKIKDSALMLPLDEITEKATREQFSNRIEPVRAEVNEVLQSLIEELDNVRRIQTTYDNVAEKLLSTESNMTATTQETPEKILSKSAEIGEVLPVLRQELETMAQSLTKPMKFVEIPQQVQPSHLENKLNEVATSNANMVKKAVTDQKVALLAPQIEALTASLQSTVNEVKNAPPASLDQQESTLRMLEAEKQKITTLLESIPEDAKEAETIKEKSTWELGRLADLIKRLGETVGEKVAALSSFFAAKAEVESQLAEIGRQLEEQQKGEDASAEPNISALAEQQQKVEKLREKLRVEIAADSLDQERSAEFDQLMSSLELMLVKIANAREAAERQIALKKVADLQKSKVNRANNELVSLIEQAFRLLNDAAAIPQSYEDLALKIAEVLNAAEQLAQEDPSAETLQSNIAEAHSAKQRLDDRWATWLKFVEERKSANTFLDAARKPLDIVEKKALRNMDEAQQDLADLIDGQGALVQLNETLEKLQTFAEQLDPLETSYADVRFLDVDYEQSEKQYEPIMSDLRSEIDQENQLLESTKHLEAELIHMRNTVSQLENLDELTNQSDSIIPEMTSALDNLKQQNALASKERRMVNPTSGLAKNAELLDELKAYLTQRIATLTEKQQQLEIEEIRSELHQIQQNPSDSQIENIESKFNQLKFSNVSTEELKQELANIKHERAEKQRLEKELGDKLRMITQELGQILLIHPLLASQVSEKTKKRKKKDTAKVATTADRSSQIAELRKSAELIETKLLPSLNQLQADIANAGLTTIATQKEVEHAAKLLDNIKSELAAKEQEKTNVEGVLHAAQELEELTSGQPHAEMPNMEATNEDLARKQIDALQADIQKINEALERLDKEPTSASMTKDEEDTLRKSKEHARAHLKQLVENCSDLQRHIDLLGELHKRNDTLAEKVLADGQALSTLQQKYQTGSVPQSLIAAEDDLRRAESIRFELDEANERLLSLQKWVGTALPQSKEASDLTKSIEETLNNCRSELDNLTQPLQEGVDLGKKIQSEKNSVSQKLSEMVSKAKDIHSISDPSQRSAELSALQQQIDPLHTQLQQLEQQLAHTEPAYVLPIEGSELDILGKSMEELKSLLSSEAEDAAKKLANAQTAAGLREISNRLRENIERAERIDIDSNAKREDLLSAMHLLEESKAELEEMQRIAESLDPTDEQANEVRNKAANEQAELGEQLLILRQSLDDRTDTLKKFDEELAKAEEDLDKLARMLAEPKESTSVEYIENILKKSDELFPSAILTLKNLAEAAKPIVEPRRKVDALLQRQADFIANAKAAEKQAEENEKRIAYTQKLAALEEELKAIEHALQTSIQLKTAETLRGFNNDSVRPLFDKFEALEEAPNEELKEQRQKLKAASIKLKNNADEKEKQVVQQENLIRDIDAQISQHEAALAAILSRYENAQPASKVEEDIHELEKIKDSALMLPLDEITEKATREQFSNRIEPVRAEVNEVLQSLIEELDNVRRIQTTYDNVAEKLLSTESNMTATTQETPEKILSKSAEIGEVLPVLRQELETMAQSLTKPMKFVEIPQQVQPSHLENKLNEVATTNANMVKKAVTDQKVALLAPQIEALTASLQSTVNEVKNAPPASLDQQESTLRMLEAEKQKITTLLESIPEDAKEAETIKEKSTWELGRLADLIKRLGETVGEKVAALSSFFAAKAEVESQLAEIGRQLEEQQKGEDASAEPNISALAEQQQKVEKLREKLRVEIAADSLDQERSAEFDQLMSSLELMLVKIANAREAAERQIALKKVADLQKSKVNRANNELVSLIEQAFRLLNDAAAIPQSYEDLALKIAEVLNAAEQLAQEDPSAETLQSNIAEAHSAKQRLDDRWATWLKFVEERKSANTFLDAARKPLELLNFENKLPLRHGTELFNTLKEDLDHVREIHQRIDQLGQFVFELEPMQFVANEVRFLLVEVEGLEANYEEILNGLLQEIGQENNLSQSAGNILSALEGLKLRFSEALRSGKPEIVNIILADLHDLKAHLVEMTADYEAMKTNRKYIAMVDVSATYGEALDKIVELESRLEAAIEEMSGPSPARAPLEYKPLEDYDVDAAAEVFAAIFRDQRPRDVLREHGFDDIDIDSSDMSSDFGHSSKFEPETFSTNGDKTREDLGVSPIPEDPAPSTAVDHASYVRQRSRWRRVLRTALPLQAMLVLLLGAACLVPHCDDEYCCHLLNNFARSFDAQLEFPNGPPPF
ncbi:nuclear envelope localization domain-containing protein [Ditylenchus destructor]|nr:nuclear envelope localization domain-containing protein [Ditylenchus destructor]